MEALCETGQGAAEFFHRHQHGDWGDLGEEDKQENEYSIDKRLRIFSAYHTNKRVKVWIITKTDRSATTILLPSEPYLGQQRCGCIPTRRFSRLKMFSLGV
jgi:ribosomal protein L39E